ncbi:hypothetical protein MKW98_025926 [Papaver atlanticum]|uniref:L-gulonolactone oxidase n=1 Tax=Papaver atlanticum TaxID=357466 RepID=A0AAD4SJQ1_9MAGN|nr:hypothetical protein MKW98_025926 [Papaver atlanticum]
MGSLGLCLSVLFGFVSLTWNSMVIIETNAMPPPSPVKCDRNGCTLYNAYGVWNDRKDCQVQRVIYPETEEELLLAVAEANKKKLKVKIVTGFSHSIPKLACPLRNSSILISTAKYNSGIDIDVKNMTVTVDSGVGLGNLIDKVEDAGLSLVVSPYWEGLSIGGIVSTGAHGSSWWGKGGVFHDHIVGISVIVAANASDGYAKIIQLDAQNPLFNAARVSLGMLGAISKVKISLEAGFKRSITNIYQNDTNLEDEFMDLALAHEFADITWYPSFHTTVYRKDDRVPLNTSGDGINDFIGFQPTPIFISESTRSAEENMEKTQDIEEQCALASTLVGYKKSLANGLKNDGVSFTGYPVVGLQGRMQASGSCLYSPKLIQSTCVWDRRIKGLFFYESGAVFPASNFGDFIRDVKKLRDFEPSNFCGLDIYIGFLMRFLKASEAYLGHSEDSVAVDFTYYRANDPLTPRMNQDIWEEIEQMAFFKYSAKPHWAKNRNLAFFGVKEKYPKFNKFLEAKKVLDPGNMFSTDLLDEIVFGKESANVEGCAMEGQCICSEDRHCNPRLGYLCQPGLIYTEAKVCRHSF